MENFIAFIQNNQSLGILCPNFTTIQLKCEVINCKSTNPRQKCSTYKKKLIIIYGSNTSIKGIRPITATDSMNVNARQICLGLILNKLGHYFKVIITILTKLNKK